jgi:hypothetical protein
MIFGKTNLIPVFLSLIYAQVKKQFSGVQQYNQEGLSYRSVSGTDNNKFVTH